MKDDILRKTVQFQCTCEDRNAFFIPLFGLKILLLLFGIFIAWMTRNVTIPVLNDSRYIGINFFKFWITFHQQTKKIKKYIFSGESATWQVLEERSDLDATVYLAFEVAESF